MAEKGLTDKQMARKLGMTEQAFNIWKNQHTEFFESLSRGKDKADERVEKSLYKQALGYTYRAQKPVVVSDGNGMGSHVETAEYRERVSPSTSAAIFWLKNRRPKKWRDKQEIEHSGEIGVSVKYDLNKLSSEELVTLQNLLAKIEYTDNDPTD